MKVLRTIRFDASDDQVFERAAGSDEWAVSGAFAFWDRAPDTLTGKDKQAFANGFLGLASYGRSTFVAVGEADDAAWAETHARFADALITAFGAPDRAAALKVAADEMAFAAGLAAEQPVNTLLAVSREVDDTGDVRETYRTVAMPDGELHTRIWDVVDDG